MTVLPTSYELEQGWQESRQRSKAVWHGDEIEQIESCPSWLGNGQRRSFCLSNSLWIEIRDESYQSDWSLQRNHDDQFPLTAKFYLAGCSHVQTRGITDEYIEQAGQNYLYCLPDTEEVETYCGYERLHFVMIWLSPSRLRSLGTQYSASFAPELQQFLEDETRPFFHRLLGQNTPEMQQVLQQLLHCPYQGVTRSLYLESQALELLSLQFARWLEQDRAAPPVLLLRSDDVERIHHARAILTENLTHPPSIVELARRVGVNDYKLKQGFRQVFKTTPFGYLREQRLELARQLLRETDRSVEEVAIAVGYQSRSSFTAAFRRQFGTSPKGWQRQMNRRII